MPRKPKRLKTLGDLIDGYMKDYGGRCPNAGSRKAISQAKLYEKCNGIDPREFPVRHEIIAAKKIREFIKNERIPTAGQIATLEVALGLEPGVLSPVSVGNGQEPSAGRRTNSQTGRGLNFQQITLLPPAQVLTGEVLRVVSNLDLALKNARHDSVTVACVVAPPGLGKSFAVSQWWHRHGAAVYTTNVVGIDCEKISGDAIIRAITAFFCGREAAAPSEELVAALRAQARPLIILDGLALSASGRSRLLAETDSESLRLIRELINFLTSRAVSCLFLVGLQIPAARAHAPGSYLFAQEVIETLQPLSPEDGATMLGEMGVRNIAGDDLRRISEHLHGLPLALEAMARLLLEAESAGDPVAVESLIAADTPDSSLADVLGHSYSKIMRAADAHKNDEDFHVEAFIRLLAVMPGQVHISTLEMLLDGGQIVRLRRPMLERFTGGNLPFVRYVGQHFSLHPLVRSRVREEIEQLVAGKASDHNVSIEELQWIHAKMALFNISKYNKDPIEIDYEDIHFIEGALYHLVALRDLGAIPAERAAGGVFAELSRRIGGLGLDAITEYCYSRIVVPYLFDRSHRITRFLGHYETKAKLLALVERGGTGTRRRKEHLAPRHARRVFTEMAVSWMNCGRLRLAHNAVTKAKAFFEFRQEPDDFAAELLDDMTNNQIREDWDEFSTLCAIQALILIRQGRIRNQIDDCLETAWPIADKVFDICRAGAVPDPRLAEPVVRAAKRIVARRGYVAHLAGELSEARRLFAAASDIKTVPGLSFLTGDAAKRHVETLIRIGATPNENIALARTVVDANLAIRTLRRAKSEQMSNDIIQMMGLDAALCRVAGELEAADRKLLEVEEHEFVRTGEAPYAARQELRMERFRLRIARGDVGPEIRDDLGAFVKELQNRHHQLLSLQASLLLAEVSPPRERGRQCRELRRQFQTLGWRLLRDDAEAIENGQSIVRDRGF